MFIVGGTGQLLTLILTVCLPFVFLFSAQPKAALLNETLMFEDCQNHQIVTSVETNNSQIHFDSIADIQDADIEFKNLFIRKFNCHQVREKWKSFHIESSGNKAPPVIHCFSC